MQNDCEYHPSSKLPGMYIHIPFCTRRCHYCDFATWGVKELAEGLTYENYADLLAKEIDMVITQREGSPYAPFHNVSLRADTLYIGGGTPSILPNPILEAILRKIRENFDLSQLQELTLEVNPETISGQKLQAWRELGVNRLSIGIQSLKDEALLNLGRAYTRQEVLETLSQFRSELSAFQLSFDLLLGVPWQDEKQVLDDIQTLLSFEPCHFSLYGLKVEEATPFERLVRAKPELAPDEDRIAEELLSAEKLLAGHSFVRYEVSNFAKVGFWSRHNLKYWTMAPFWGFGVSAAGFDGRVRTYNPKNFEEYRKRILAGIPSFSCETLSEGDYLLEKLALGLRTIWGVRLSEFPRGFAHKLSKRAEEMSKELPHLFSSSQNGRISLTGEGMNVMHSVVTFLTAETDAS